MRSGWLSFQRHSCDRIGDDWVKFPKGAQIGSKERARPALTEPARQDGRSAKFCRTCHAHCLPEQILHRRLTFDEPFAWLGMREAVDWAKCRNILTYAEAQSRFHRSVHNGRRCGIGSGQLQVASGADN